VEEVGVVVVCTSSWVLIMRLSRILEVMDEMELQPRAFVDALSASNGRVVDVDGVFEAAVREPGTLAEVCSIWLSERRGGDVIVE